jgi:hypothetical protein
MSYVPVEIWVPDTVDGPVVDILQLKPCDTCKAPIPIELMDAHITEAHTPPEVMPH